MNDCMLLFAQAKPLNLALIFGILLFVLALFVLVALPIWTIILRASLKWFAGLDVGFGHAYGVSFLLILISSIQQILFRLALYGSLPERGEPDISGLIGFPIIFCLQSLLIGAQFELSFLRACLVELGIFLVCLVIAIVIAAVVLIFSLVAL
ncbi:hypothetical protein [uncultured Rubinisphaera sp.]|uniref:hypothetical protein n=1 Tax=uncultured Rubinisphaera sp. TaxID=1678686 RepID=UPI0030DA9521